jgi:hypothetical protein
MSQQGPELRIGDAEREAAVTSLGEHFAAGRLSKDEFDERSERAWSARTASQLWPLFADLPRPQRHAAGGPAPARGPGDCAGRAGHGWWRAAVLPLVLVVAALVVLAHLPLILLVVGIVLLVRLSRHRGWHSHGYGGRATWGSYRWRG